MPNCMCPMLRISMISLVHSKNEALIVFQKSVTVCKNTKCRTRYCDNLAVGPQITIAKIYQIHIWEWNTAFRSMSELSICYTKRELWLDVVQQRLTLGKEEHGKTGNEAPPI